MGKLCVVHYLNNLHLVKLECGLINNYTMFLPVFTPGDWYGVIFLPGAGHSYSRTVAVVAIYACLLSDCYPAGTLSGQAGDYFPCDSKTSVAQ